MKGHAVKKTLALAALIAIAATPALAHPGHGAESFAAGVAHPLTGLDHIAVMIAVGLWAALKSGRALWAWPAVFVGVMLAGGALGMAHVALPLVEPGILASVVVLGLMVALAVDVPVAAGAALIGVFALLHGHAHGTEIAENLSGFAYMAGF
ncbi:MAG: HupE/UreJ family protein, partial [Candidatus Eiseniibacteriota bacterium]